MFIHIFGFRWKPEATDADKARAAHDIAAFRDHILGLIDVHVGPNLSPRGQGYEIGGAMKFPDKAALEAVACAGGVLGIEQHRAAPGGVQDLLAKDGYVMESYVKQMAKEGFPTTQPASMPGGQ